MFERERNKSGWVYLAVNIGNSKFKDYIKIGETTLSDITKREENTNGAEYKVFFGVFVDDCQLYEKIIHNLLENLKYKKAKNVKGSTEFFNVQIKHILPLLLEIGSKFQVRDEHYCTDICKIIDENENLYTKIFCRNLEKFTNLRDEFEEQYGVSKLLKKLLTEKVQKNKYTISTSKQELKDKQKTVSKNKYWKIGENGYKEYDYRSFLNDYNLFNKKFYFFHTKIHKEYVAVLQRDMNFLYKNKSYSPSGLAKIFYKEKYGKDMGLRGFDWLAPEGFTKPVLYLLENFENIEKYREK